MNRLFEFMQHHPYLTSGVGALAIVAIVIEIRHRLVSASAVGTADAVRLLNGGALVIDLRPAEAYAAGHIIDSRHIQQSELGAQAEALLKKYREKPVIVCCETGVSSGASASMLKSLGFTKVFNLRGGIAAWKQDNLPLVSGSGEKSAKGGSGSGKQKGGK